MASRYELNEGDLISLATRRGRIQTSVKITDIIEDEVIFMPFHFAQGANVLTNTALDEIAKIPELKVCAVRLDKEVV